MQYIIVNNIRIIELNPNKMSLYNKRIIESKVVIFLDILDKIVKLRKERHWTEYELAERSGLTQSTISTWYRKNMIPSIPSLQKICDAFGISISQFFYDKDCDYTIMLNEKQYELIEVTSRLNTEQFSALLEFLKKL